MTNKKAIEELKYRLSIAKYIEENYVDYIRIETVELAIKALENEPKKGEWIDHSDETIEFGGTTFTPPLTCSECGKSALNESWWYCPNCGVKMEN